ncbi:MAG: hypothetical protein P8X64_16525 [Anaerolineales bacterium]
MFRRIPPLLAFLLALILVGILSFFGPPERSLGANVRLVYLHGAWVWTALIGLGSAAAAGLAGLLLQRPGLQRWSIALGQSGMFFWISYLPLSLWTMQANWNGLYLAEPRFKIGLDYAVIGLLLQAAILVLRSPRLGSALNLAFAIALGWSIRGAEQVMHPESPIFGSNSIAIRLFFLLLLLISLLAGLLLARWLHALQPE